MTAASIPLEHTLNQPTWKVLVCTRGLSEGAPQASSLARASHSLLMGPLSCFCLSLLLKTFLPRRSVELPSAGWVLRSLSHESLSKDD